MQCIEEALSYRLAVSVGEAPIKLYAKARAVKRKPSVRSFVEAELRSARDRRPLNARMRDLHDYAALMMSTMSRTRASVTS